jgi:hypothetical protein
MTKLSMMVELGNWDTMENCFPVHPPSIIPYGAPVAVGFILEDR